MDVSFGIRYLLAWVEHVALWSPSCGARGGFALPPHRAFSSAHPACAFSSALVGPQWLAAFRYWSHVAFVAYGFIALVFW